MENLKVKDVLYSKFLMVIVFFTFLLTNCYLDFFPTFKSIINLLIVIFTLLFLLIYIFDFKFNTWSIILLVYLFISFLSTIIYNLNNLNNFFTVYVKILGLSLYLELSLRNNARKTISILNCVFFILLAINFLTLLIFPNGMYNDSLYDNNWFFQYDNMHILYYYAALIVSFSNNFFRKKNTIIFYLEIIMIVFGIIKCFSATTLISFSLFIILIICSKLKLKNEKNRKNSIKNSVILMFSYLLINFSITLFNIQKYFAWFIEKILHKSITLSSRVPLWESVFRYINLRPILGYGIESANEFSKHFGIESYTHAHNTIFDVWYKSGLFGLISFLLLVFIPLMNLNKFSNCFLGRIFKIIILCVLILTIVEAREDRICIYVILVIANNINYIMKGDNYEQS